MFTRKWQAERDEIQRQYAAAVAADERAAAERTAAYEAQRAAEQAARQAERKDNQDQLRRMTPAEHLEAAIQASTVQAQQTHLLFALTKSMVGGGR